MYVHLHTSGAKLKPFKGTFLHTTHVCTYVYTCVYYTCTTHMCVYTVCTGTFLLLHLPCITRSITVAKRTIASVVRRRGNSVPVGMMHIRYSFSNACNSFVLTLLLSARSVNKRSTLS